MNCVTPETIPTPLIPFTMPTEKVKQFGKQVPMKRLANLKYSPRLRDVGDEASYVSGATVA